ncbi:MAG TPA: hypothetical protein PLM52_12865 [Tabrizicola sp.]|nr:hypothetical protein [Tabrizicola sp.]
MSRDGSNIYSAPAGTLAVSGTTIESAKYNAFVNDLVADANLPRPIVAGGTGVSTAGGWLAAMGVTATAAELNTLDGITATVAELNVLDGIPGTLTATEIGYLDGVTSAIQTQLNAKQATITTLPLANGGTGVALADPGADRIMFWDDSAGAVAFLEPGAGLALSGTTLTAGAVSWQTAISVTSGTSTSISTTIPATATEILLRFKGVQVTTSDNVRIRVGPSGGVLTGGYSGGASIGGAGSAFVTAFGITLSGATRVGNGLARLTKTDTNIWLYSMDGFDTSGDNQLAGFGELDVAATLSRLEVSVTGGAFTGSGLFQIGWR